MRPLKVIGSCRVYEPLRMSGATLDQSGVYAYTHNVREHLQMLCLADRASHTDSLIADLAAVPVGYGGMSKADFQDRFFVVEVSSIRILRYKDWYLQMNRFANFCERFIGEKFRPDQFGSDEKLKSILSRYGDNPLNLDRFMYFEQSAAELCHYIERINGLLRGRVLFVCHFNSDRGGAPFWQRTRIQSCLERMQRSVGIHVFDPTPHVLRRSPERALKDNNHYTPEFEREMIGILADAVHRLAART